MGAIKSSKLDNGMVGLEITYGGKDAPFSGVDFSAPLPYIDPTGFANNSGFLVIDGTLLACGWFPLPITLAGWTSGMTYLDSGSFYQNKNYWNWSLAYTSSYTPASGGTLGYTDTIYTIWTWQGLYPGSVPVTATLDVRQPDVVKPATLAEAIINCSGTSTASGSVTLAFNPDAGGIGPYVVPISSGANSGQIAYDIVNYMSHSTPMASHLNFGIDPTNPSNVLITPNGTGSAGNNNSVSVTQTAFGATVSLTQNFTGGSDPVTSSFPAGAPNPVSWTCIGETLYIGGYGSMILQYSQATGTPSFTVCTQYLGAICIGKFNSQLIAAGVVPGPGMLATGGIPQPEMVLAWSAPNEFSTWNPENSDGTVTGAGFNQISDISDYLTGIFLTPGTAVIMRTQGIDYITPLAGGISPFDFAHVSNAFKGEGCQHFKLVTEYDQIGSFVGNTNIYQFSGSLIPIGDKIKNWVFTRSSPTTYHNRDSASGPYLETNALQAFSIWVMDSTMYIYNYNNKAWMLYYLATSGANVFDLEWLTRDEIPPDRPQEICNSSPILITEDTSTAAPAYWRLQSFVQDLSFPHGSTCFVNFPAEEIAFGRDITIESAYVAVAGTPGAEINFWINQKLHALLILPSTASPSVYSQYQVWFVADPTLDDKTTIQAPQLSISLPSPNTGANVAVRFSKIALFGSFDPNQRPV